MGTLVQAPFSPAFVSEFQSVTMRILGEDAHQDWLASAQWRLENMPDVTVFVAEADSRLVGFKAGYAVAYNRYYSWLGGVDPDFRRQGIARQMMSEQHEWLGHSRFRLIETHVAQDNKAMIRLNLDGGLDITGFFLKDGKPYFVMQKEVMRSSPTLRGVDD